jgi:cytochrome P450
MQAFTDYLRQMFEEKRKHPKDDLISALVRAEEAGDKLSEDELLGMVFLLLVAGHETTVNLIGNGVLALLQHPEQLEKLKADPSLIKDAVEELLRYDGPVETSTERFASEDVQIGETLIPRGEMVLVVIASADRDPNRFPEPDALDITRSDNRHLAFGKGIHHCLGAPLARMEGQIAISTLLRRMPELRLKDSPETLSWRQGMVLRGLRALPVAF